MISIIKIGICVAILYILSFEAPVRVALLRKRFFRTYLENNELSHIKKWSNAMFNYKNIFVCILLSISLVSNPPAVLAATGGTSPNKNPNSPETMAVDLIFLRPLGMVATVAGIVVFVVSLPFSALGGNTQEALDSLVITPAEYTFVRPLGDTE